MARAYPVIPSVVSGYDLNNKRGLFRFVRAEATENILPNPSFEHPFTMLTTPTGYLSIGGALILQSLTNQRRGYKGAELITAFTNEVGLYTTFSATANTTYTFSADLLGAGGETYRMYFTDDFGVMASGVTTLKSYGRWQRPHVSFMAHSTATHRVCLTRADGGSRRSFFTDGWQLEAKPYPTTYADGSMMGFVDNRMDFYWLGAPHESRSIRIAQCRAGGRLYDLRDFGWSLLGINGLGYEDIINYTTPLARGGSYYHGSNRGDGHLYLLGAIHGADSEALAYNRARIEQIIDFDDTSPEQPITVLYSLECRDPWNSEYLEIVAIPESFPGNRESDTQERASLNLMVNTPYAARRYGDIGVSMSYQTSVANANRALKRDAEGNWTALSTGTNANSVRGYKRLPNGRYIVYGDFTQAAAVANTNGAALYDPITNTFSSMFNAAGFAGAGDVNDVVVAPDGFAYFGGAWTSVDGIANTANIAAWNYTTGLWSSVANPASSSTVFSLHYAIDGSLFVGSSSGGFGMTIDVVVLATTIAIRSAAGVWSGTPGLNFNIVLDIEGSLDGTVYASENTTGIYRWTGTAWSEITTDNPSVASLLFTPDGRMYVGLINLDTISGVDVNFCGYFNGVTFFPLGSGFDNNALKAAHSAQDGLIYYCGTYTTADGITLPDSMSGWNGSAHVPLDVDLPGASTVNDIFSPSPDYLFVGYSTGGTALAGGVNIINNPGTADTYPTITITGPGRLFQVKNYTTGVAVYFNITLLEGETITLDFAAPSGPLLTSSFRGNILGYVISGSNLDLFLKPGRNALSLFITGDDPLVTDAYLVFRPRFATLSGWALDRVS